MTDSALSRRGLLSRASLLAAGAAAAGPLGLLSRNVAHAAGSLGVDAPAGLLRAAVSAADGGGYGPIVEDGAMVELPEGFRAVPLSPRGSLMRTGEPVPGGHDGMACFPMEDGTLRLVRNHELGGEGTFGPNAYNANRMGGTTTVVFDPETGTEVETFPSITGLYRPCGGGPTPWGTWLAAEETTGTYDGLPHGYVFEVDAAADGPVDPVPLRAMGRMNHEAVAVDPLTGAVYETEDSDPGGVFRFLPAEPGDLAAGGELQMLSIPGVPYSSRGQTAGTPMPATWVPILVPDPDDAVFQLTQGKTLWGEGVLKGGTSFARAEGAWTGVDPDTGVVTIFWACTSGGDASSGQIWAYQPSADPMLGTVTLLFESPDPSVLSRPDNIAVHPTTGVVVLCEDEGWTMDDERRRRRLQGITPTGEIFEFARQHRSEFAGVCFSPDGRWMFANVQGDGITYAITGPWEQGALG